MSYFRIRNPRKIQLFVESIKEWLIYAFARFSDVIQSIRWVIVHLGEHCINLDLIPSEFQSKTWKGAIMKYIN